MDGGRRQRVGVARALALILNLFICDERICFGCVHSSPDSELLMGSAGRNEAYLYVYYHDLSVVKHISDEIAVMYLGQCVERAESKELFKNPMHPYTKALLSAIPLPRLTGKKDRQIIKGEVSDPIDPKPGCRFAARCDYCTEKCLGQDIPLKEQVAGHFVACTLYR
jgi:oligopeptide/dipeptide ABC transporter ATP-binding protein